MSKKKRIIVTVVTILIVAALAAGAVTVFLWNRNNKLVAEVMPVEAVMFYYWGDETSSSGMVTNDDVQDVFLMEDQTISEVFVTEGQEVKAGDPLMAYDMTKTNLELEMQQLEIETINNKITLAARELEKLKNTTPIPDTPPEPEPAPEPEPEPEPPVQPEEPQIEEMTKNAYNYISSTAKPYQGEGTKDDPYTYLCMPECYVEGAFLNSLAESKKPVFVMFEIRENNKVKGEVLSYWSVNSKSIMRVEDDTKWSVKTRKQVVEQEEEEPDETIDDSMEEEADMVEPEIDDSEQQGYTAEELNQEIKSTQKELKDLDLDRRKQELELEQMKKVSADGVVSASMDGVVKMVGDKENPPTDGEAFITVSGSEGLYVSGSLSELDLGNVKVGQTVYANSYESGKSFEATITEISQYPSESSNSWGEGNPNVSYYPYVAYIKDTEGLKNGEYVDLKMTPAQDENQENSDTLYLQKAYIREEDGKSYVLKADKNNRLVKQYVETGKTVYGEGVEIKSGLSKEDRIAFPYGKTAKEGLKVEESSDSGVSMF